MAIRTDGTLWAWGAGLTGRLGNQSTADRSSPVQIGTLTGWSGVFAGGGHTMAIRTNGTLWGWGLNTSGQIGDNTTTNKSSPVQIGTLTNWQSAAPGSLHTTAIKTDGTLWASGENSVVGQIGDGTLLNRSSPVQIGPLINWSKVSAGGSHVMSITSGGLIYTWGDNTSGQLGLNSTIGVATTTQNAPVRIQLGTNWSTISLGADHGMATKTDGTLWGWGVNAAGQIGDGTVTTRSSPTQIGTLTGWSKVSTGASHTMAIYTDGSLWAWGLGTSGQLGYDTIVPSRLIPTNDWAKISAGDTHSIAIKTDGTLWGWGSNGQGQIGDGTVISRSSPVQIGTLTNWANISTGVGYSMSIKTDGTLWGWGNNTSFGPLGDNTTTSKSSPIQIGTLLNWSKVACGGAHTAAIKTDGTLWTWGSNVSGQLGQNNTTPRSSPVQVGTLNDWVEVSCGYNTAGGIQTGTTLLVKTNGTLWGMGGTIGDNSGSNRSSPVQIGTLTNWSKVSAGNGSTPSAHNLAVKTDGTLWSWGGNASGQLGNGTITSNSSPIQIGTDMDWSNAFAGLSYSMAIKTDGTLWGWGLNSNGELGINDRINRSSPVQVGSLTSWYNVEVGSGYTIGLKSDNSIWGWGLASSGQLARGVVNATTSLSSPIQIGEDQWSSVYAGNLYTTAIKTNGTLWAWGVNTAGFLGDASVISRSAPVQIGSRSGWTQVSSGASHTIAIYEE
jgi:alpha-tubulin suppressor-like RCC1 family protein